MQGVRLRRSVKRPSAESSAKPSLLKGTLGNGCLTKRKWAVMRHVVNYSLASNLSRETNGQQQVMTVHAKIGHVLGKLLLMHTGRFTPFGLSWKVLRV